MMSNTEQIAGILARTADALGEKRLPPPTVKLYAQYLHDIPAEQIAAACHSLVMTATRMPKISTIRQFVEKQREAQSTDAWAAVERQLTNAIYGTPSVDDPVAEAAVRELGGYKHLATIDREKLLAFERPRFLKAYDAMSDRRSVALALGQPDPFATLAKGAARNLISEVAESLGVKG